MVSHDRDFLNTVTTDIIHLHDQRLHAYRGNFAQFEEMYEQRRREVNKVAEKFEKQMKVAKKSGSKANQDKVRLLTSYAAAEVPLDRADSMRYSHNQPPPPPPQTPTLTPTASTSHKICRVHWIFLHPHDNERCEAIPYHCFFQSA